MTKKSSDYGNKDQGLNLDVSRRGFLKGTVAAAVTVGSAEVLTGCANEIYDYIVVGAGPGGAPLAANLAKEGYRVALVEAGMDPKGEDAALIDPNVSVIYETPGLFPATSEHPLLSWDFFVNHYENEEQQKKDSKYVDGKGILYPRGSCLGGSSSHNALVFIYPHDSDFDFISDVTGDSSWNAQDMREYFVRVENCAYCEVGSDGHGFNGYMPTSVVEPSVYELFPTIKDFSTVGGTLPGSYYEGNTSLDINHPLVAQGDTGMFVAPMHVENNKRVTVRDYLIETRDLYPENLTIITNALVTKVIMSEGSAVGVEYLESGGVNYTANKLHDSSDSDVVRSIYAKNEVILSGGTFNTPQLLMLSGIGPAKELMSHGIDVVCDLPGVGANLQDRYEVSLAVDLKENLELFARCRPFQEGDPCLASYLSGEWETEDEFPAPYHGPYASNVIFATRIAKSSVAKEMPDLFLIGLPAPFTGYYPGHSQKASANRWTWLVLKAHNENTAGKVKLRSADPKDTPLINFHYFEEGNDSDASDLQAMVEGVQMVRNTFKDAKIERHILEEVLPGEDVKTKDDIEEFVRNEAWGHHAASTCKIGSDDDPMAVLDSRFRVRGVNKLRVVDASVFPKIPGFFPVASILMISEKASDVIIEDSKNNYRK